MPTTQSIKEPAKTTALIGRLLGFRAVHFILLAALPFVVYSNNYHHDYLLDDAYTIRSNQHLRSLSEIPRYFVDPSTYGSLREQADYRPVLLTTYAIDYALGEYNTWWWHFTQILLHVAVTIGIYLLARRLLLMMGDGSPDRIALAAALVFAIHPANSGVVNYLNARSSLLTATFLVYALLAYMKPISDARYSRPQWLATALYALALFTKIEAIGILGAFWAFELWQRNAEQPSSLLTALRRSFDKRSLVRIAPALIVTVVYVMIRRRLMEPFPFAEARHAADVGAYQYILTQVTAWWYYISRWIAPFRLVADYLAYPVYRSWNNPVVLFAVGGWIVVATILVFLWRKSAYLLFIALAALAIISPTSSFSPLAEMVNEHRPYLPIAIASLAFFIPVGRLLRRYENNRLRGGIAAGGVVVLIALALLTYDRNTAFSTDRKYWQDILDKAPSSRAYLNYGRTLAAAGDYSGAIRNYQQALQLSPNWFYIHNNLAVAYLQTEQMDSARAYFERGVTSDRYSGLGLTSRGEFHLAVGEFGPARDDFLASLQISLDRYRSTRGLATAYAGLGDVTHAFERTDELLRMDSASAVQDIAGIALPFFKEPNLHSAGVEYYRKLAARLPNAPWIQENISRLQNMASTTSATASSSNTDASMKEGLDLLYKSADPVRAAEAFRKVLALNPTHYGATYQLAVALDNAGRPAEATPVWQKVLGMAQKSGDQKTIDAARARLQRKP